MFYVFGVMHDARALANFFIDRAAQKARPITTMTLLKVLYFAHAWHLAKYGRPLVAQPFEAWKHGPVNRVVYDQMKALGAKHVTDRLISFDAEICGFRPTPYCFEPDLNKFLENIFDYYSQFDAFKLSDLTHEKGSPWDVVWSEAEKRAVPGMLIPDSLIMSWFREGGVKHLRKHRGGMS